MLPCMTTPATTMRIGELAARTGVSVHVLRVWERRYGLLIPSRSTGGYRLYGPQDEWRVREAVRLREQGLPTAQAAETALSASRQVVPPRRSDEADEPPSGEEMPAGGVAQLRDRLLQATADFDGAEAHAVLDLALQQLGVETSISSVILPVLHETGERWASGQFTVAQEHFASNLVRSRLSTLTLAWGSGSGPVAVLACPPGERHDLGLLSFGVVLGRAGWRIGYLGADTPVATLGSAVEALNPDVVVLSAVRNEPLIEAVEQLQELSDLAAKALAAAQFGVAGAGATADVAERLGAVLLDGDPVDAARLIAERGRERAP